MRRAAAFAVTLSLSAAVQATDEPLTLHYQARAPYSSRSASGEVQGLVATPAAEALKAAGLPFRWSETPPQRQLALIQGDSGRHCGIGWFRNAEREAKGKFSRALYRDRPFVGIVRTDLQIGEGARASELLLDARYPVLLKEGFSYGAALDAVLARAATPVRTSAELHSMPDMLRAKRAAWMLAAPEEAEQLLGPGLRQVAFVDTPPGETRHLYCNRQVPDDWIARIDRAIAARPAR